MNRATRCDACGKRVRAGHHEAVVRDALTGQLLGVYHAGLSWGSCQARAAKYTRPGVVLRVSFVHPDRCGPEQEHCDAGLAEAVA